MLSMRLYFSSFLPILVSGILASKKAYKGAVYCTDVEENRLGDDEFEEMVQLLLAILHEVLLQIALVNLRRPVFCASEI
jgi:hypothetical protein